MSFEMTEVKNICRLVTSGGTPLTSNRSFYEPKEIPWLKTAEVNYCRIYKTEKYISEEGLKRSSAKLIPENSVIVAMYGQGDTAGRVAINKIPLSTNQACCNLVIDETKADYRFVYYALSMLYEKLVSLKNGGAQPNLNAGIIKAMEIPNPELEIQRRIADILSAYDDLIENNQKQIKLLEEAEQRLYKEWFVELNFKGYEKCKIIAGIPEGWDYLPLQDVIGYDIGGGWGEETIKGKNEHEAYVIRGTDFDGLENGEIQSIPIRYHTESNLSARILKSGDIVFEVSGGSRDEGVARTVLITESLINRLGKPVMCASFCKLVRPERPETSQYLFDHFRYLRASKITEEFDKRSASSIVNYRWKDFLSQRYILMPSDEVLQEYNKVAARISEKKANLSLQIETIKSARDSLLPKLMSGEIEL